MFSSLLKGRMGFIERSLRGTEWSQLFDYLSPALLDVLPVTSIAGQARRMLALSRDRGRFVTARAAAVAAVREQGVAVVAESPEAGAELASLDEATRKQIGETALALYFGQIAHCETGVLDLRASRFGIPLEKGEVPWDPRPLLVTWDPEFLASIRSLYAGYYRDDTDRFDGALRELHLEPARDVFLSHFGPGDQRAVRFGSRVFHSTFHDAFVKCRDAGEALHPDFIALGAFLACLYDVLEVLDLEFDVRAVFERVWTGPAA